MYLGDDVQTLQELFDEALLRATARAAPQHPQPHRLVKAQPPALDNIYTLLRKIRVHLVRL